MINCDIIKIEITEYKHLDGIPSATAISALAGEIATAC